jgi:alpha-D-xyloside xylohydrolase
MAFLRKDGNTLLWQKNHETVRIEAWGRDSLRVRATLQPELPARDWALLAQPESTVQVQAGEDGGWIQNGRLRAEVAADGHLRFVNSAGKVLLEEEPLNFAVPPARLYRANQGGLFHSEVKFLAQEGEGFYGLGQHQHGLLDQKGCVLELVQRNKEVSIPFMISTRGYGFLWNNPAVGRVELGRSLTRWVAESTPALDYWITADDSYAGLLESYTAVTGRSPLLPPWAAGFWQCKLRYRTQEELLQVAREYKRRGLPIAVIVVDFFHWTLMGDWKFDPACWPDPAGMVRELDEMGIKLMVSVWPTVNGNSANYELMQQQGWLVRTERGIPASLIFMDNGPKNKIFAAFYDTTHPDARRYVWEQVKKNYYDLGIRVWWLDACEPEIYPSDHDNLRYHLGNGLEVGCVYPLMHEQGFYEGMRAAGEEEIIALCRSAWAGSQRFGAAVWSGDIHSTFEALRAQVRAGLNIGLSGIPWWTTDIGGFSGGDTTTPYFHELIVRWFQYGVFCPLFRLHGYRLPNEDALDSGGPNEIWSFGEDVYAILKDLLFLRERMQPYLLEQMREASASGLPPMRPLFLDFQNDPVTFQVEDQFLFGPQVLVAPVLEEGARQRRVYLPAGASWTNAWTGEVLQGGQWLSADAPLERIPVFFRDGAAPFALS